MAKEAYNTYGLRPLYPERSKITKLPVATAQTLAKGDPVILSTGQIAVAVSNSSAEIVGIMAQDAVLLTAGTLVDVYADTQEIFVGRAAADHSSVAIGYQPDLTGTTGAFEVNMAASTQDVFVFLGTLPGDTSSVAGARVMVKICKHAFADTSS